MPRPPPPRGHSAFLLFFSHFELLFRLFPSGVLWESHLHRGTPAKLSGLLHVWSAESSLSSTFPLFGMNAHTLGAILGPSIIKSQGECGLQTTLPWRTPDIQLCVPC